MYCKIKIPASDQGISVLSQPKDISYSDQLVRVHCKLRIKPDQKVCVHCNHLGSSYVLLLLQGRMCQIKIIITRHKDSMKEF